MKEEIPKEKTLRETVEELVEVNKQLVEQKKVKKFSLPWKARLNKKKLADGYVTVCYVNENKAVDLIKVPIDESTIKIKGAYHIATADDILSYKGKPMMIVSAWNSEPYSPKRDLEKAEDNNTTMVGQRYILNKLQKDSVENVKKPFPVMILVIGLAIVGILLWLLPKLKSGGLGI